MTEIILPAMGEGIIEATVTKILKKESEMVEADEAIIEVATDKVDTEIVSPYDGVIKKINCKEDDTIEVGSIVAYILSENDEDDNENISVQAVDIKSEKPTPQEEPKEENQIVSVNNEFNTNIFLSPLVKSIAQKENIKPDEIENIKGTGLNQRITKDDILNYLKNRLATPQPVFENKREVIQSEKISFEGDFEVKEMDRMRSIIAERMIESKQTSAHVTSFVEVDMTNVVRWRNKVKEDFIKKSGEKITFMPIFIEAIMQAIKDFPGINVSLEGNKIIYKKDINIGMAAALPNGNLIVPVIHQTDNYSLSGLAKKVNDLANRARKNKLQLDEISGGTFTITNMGTFGNITGTPIINQPEVAILAVGEIKKKPAVIETPEGDLIGIRHLMVMSMSYDHRIVDGALGGMFLKRVAEYLENFDTNRKI